MKKLAIFLCLALLVSSMASIGLSAVADETEGTVVFESDFSTMPEAFLPVTGGYTIAAQDGVLKSTIASVTGWKNALTTDTEKLPLVWETDGNNKYKIKFDWTLPDATTASNSELRMILYAGGVRAEDHRVAYGAQAAGTSGTFEAVIEFNGPPRYSSNTFTESGSLAAYFTFTAKSMLSFTIDNMKITDLSPADSEDDKDDETTGKVIFSTDFSTDTVEGLEKLATSGTYSYSNNSAGTRVNKIVDGAWVVKETAANAGRWRGAFGTYTPDVPLTWKQGNVYVIEFDWTIPESYDDTAALRAIMETDLGKGSNENGTRAYEYKVIEEGTTQAEATSGHVTWTVTLDSETVQHAIADDAALRVIFRGKGLTGFTIDNFTITDQSPEPEEPVGTETVILDTDFSTATVDGLLALGGGTARYYGNAEGDINGIVDGAWKSFKANYAEDTASKLQWYSAWGTHTTANPIIWGQNYEYRVEFDWAIPGACTDAQFRLIMEGAHLNNPSLNNNGDPRPYEVGIYNTDGTYSAAGTKITQTEASSGSFKATFAVNNLNLNEDNTPKDGATLRFVVRSQLESFTIDNLKITRVAIAPDVKEEPEEPGEELETKVLVETDFTSMPLGLGNTWGGAYEIVGIKDELDVWQADAEQTPEKWKMIFNTVYDICPIVWGEGHSYKVELSYSLPKGTGDTGRFEIVLDKDDGEQDNRATQTSVFNAGKSGAIEAGDTVYTYEKTFVTSGTPKAGTFVDGDPIMMKFMAYQLPAIYIHSIKITDLNAALCPEIKLPEVDDTEEEVSQPITVTVALVDEDGKPLANQGFKLDAGEILTTDNNGRYEFKDVISGAYTINLVDEDGNVISSAYYTILAGEATDIFGNFATIDKTVKNLFITMKYADGKLTVEEMTVDVPAVDDDDSNDGDDDTIIDNGSSDTDAEEETESPETGDTFCVWAFVVVALSGAVALFFSKKRTFSAK